MLFSPALRSAQLDPNTLENEEGCGVFAGDGYSAGYYSYLWSDVLTADAFGAFVEGGGPYDHKVAERLRKYIFSVGNTIDPAEAYRQFRGRDPRVEALMKKRGFSGTETKAAPGPGVRQ